LRQYLVKQRRAEKSRQHSAAKSRQCSVPENHHATKAVKLMATFGGVESYGKTFRGDKTATRYEAVFAFNKLRELLTD